MTYVLTKDLTPHFIGFEDFDKVMKSIVDAATTLDDQVKFPAYNIHKLNEQNYIVEMQLPGFKAANLQIEMTDTILTVSGSRKVPYASAQKLYGTIDVPETFEKKFIIPDSMIVNEIAFEDGTLHISIIKLITLSERMGKYPSLYKRGVTAKIDTSSGTPTE